MAIVRQVDASCPGLVAFIESEPRWIKGRLSFQEMNSGDTYFVDVHRRPLGTTGIPLVTCAHRHREVDAAVRCAERMLRRVCREHSST